MSDIKFMSSGKIGDVLYCLPFCLAYSRTRGKNKFDFHIRTNVKDKVFIGKVMLTNDAANNAASILERQPYIGELSVGDEAKSGYLNLDQFRNIDAFNLSCGSISQWYYPLDFEMTNPPNLEKSWIKNIEPKTIEGKKIVLFRSQRYRRAKLDFRFLEQFKDEILMIGIEEEFADFKFKFFDVDCYKVSNFYEAAQLIKGAKFTIGNQTGLFGLAEGMKTPRLLETAFECPNVVMMGGSFQYICHSFQFPKVFNAFYERFCKENEKVADNFIKQKEK